MTNPRGDRNPTPAGPDEESLSGPKRAPFVLLVLGLIGAGLCALLALNTVAAADEVQQRSLNSANSDTDATTQQLQLEVANRQAPAALASAARALGLVPNPHPAFLVVQPDGTVALMGSPAPAAAPVTPTPIPTVTPTVTPAAGTTPTAPVTPAVTPTVTTSVTPSGPAIPVSTLPGGPR
jgi:hypothetical protein